MGRLSITWPNATFGGTLGCRRTINITPNQLRYLSLSRPRLV